MGASVAELARGVGGACRGDGDREILDANSILKAGPHDITFAADEQNLRRLKGSSAGAAVVAADQADRAARESPELALIVVRDPQEAFLQILQRLRPAAPRQVSGISPHAVIDPSAKIGAETNVFPGAVIGPGVEIGAGCDIHPGVVIGANCRLGDGCTLHPHAVLYPGCLVGHRVIIHAGAVLGADGFGYRFVGGAYEKIPQLGSVLVQDDVEIGACTTIDRGMLGPTVIGAGTKLDNLVMIGHNCELGRHNAFASQVGFAGSVTTGDYVRCAGQVGVAGHIHLGANSLFGAKAGVHKDMAPNGHYLGAPASDEGEQIRSVMALRKLPELRKQFRDLERRLEELEARQGPTLARLPDAESA